MSDTFTKLIALIDDVELNLSNYSLLKDKINVLPDTFQQYSDALKKHETMNQEIISILESQRLIDYANHFLDILNSYTPKKKDYPIFSESNLNMFQSLKEIKSSITYAEFRSLFDKSDEDSLKSKTSLIAYLNDKIKSSEAQINTDETILRDFFNIDHPSLASKQFPNAALNACLNALVNTIGIPQEYWQRWQTVQFMLAKLLNQLQLQYHPDSDGMVDLATVQDLAGIEGGLRSGCIMISNDPDKWDQPAIAAKCFRDGSVQQGRDGDMYVATGLRWTKIKTDRLFQKHLASEMAAIKVATGRGPATEQQLFDSLREILSKSQPLRPRLA